MRIQQQHLSNSQGSAPRNKSHMSSNYSSELGEEKDFDRMSMFIENQSDDEDAVQALRSSMYKKEDRVDENAEPVDKCVHSIKTKLIKAQRTELASNTYIENLVGSVT